MTEIIDLQRELAQMIAARVPHSRIRAMRMKIARLKGQHTKQQWLDLCAEFDHRCVQCGRAGLNLDKDHILPVYQGGSDGVDNIQPLCAWCNAGKGKDSTNWAEHRRTYGFDAS